MNKHVKTNLRLFVRSFWATLLFCVIALAVVVQLGRAAFPILSDYRVVLEAFFSNRIGADVHFGTLEADWHGLTPEMTITDLRVVYQGHEVFTAELAELEWNLLATIRDWRAGVRKLRFQGLATTFVQNEEGSWRVAGLPEKPQTSPPLATADGEPIIDDPVDIFVFGRRLELLDTELTMQFRTGTEAVITVPKIQLENDNRFHRLQAELAIEGEKALSLVVEGYGDPRNEASFTAKGFMQSEGFAVSSILKGLEQSGLFQPGESLAPYLPDQGQFNIALWFKGTLRSGLHFLGRTKLDGLNRNEPGPLHWPDTISSEFRGFWSGESGWQFSFSDAQAQWPEFQTPSMQIQITSGIDAPITIASDTINIEEWIKAAVTSSVLPQELAEVLGTLAPKGVLQNPEIQLLGADEGYFRLRSYLKNGSAQAWQGAPALSGIDGYISSTAFDGHISLANEDGFSMDFPLIYDNPLEFLRAKGDVRWTVYKDEKWIGISSGDVVLTREDIVGRGHFNLRIPFKHRPGFEPEMSLMVGVKKAPIKYHSLFVPSTAPEPLRNWLSRAVQAGQAENIAFIYHGTLLKKSELARAIQLSGSVSDAEISFDKQWPSLKQGQGTLLVDDEQFIVQGLQGQLFDNQVVGGNVYLRPDANGHRGVEVQLQVQGQSQKLLSLLMESPVQEQLDASLNDWRLGGDYAGEVNVRVPLADGNPMEQDVRLQLANNKLVINNPDLTFTKINGELHYSHLTGLNANNLRGHFWRKPFEADIKTLREEDNNRLAIHFNGNMDIKDLRSWVQRPELNQFNGEAPVAGVIEFPYQSPVSMRAQITSSLKGVQVDLPAPLAKAADAELPTKIDFYRTKTQANKLAQTHFNFNFGNALQLKWALEQGQWKGGALGLSREAPAVQDGVFQVAGTVIKADGLQWFETLNRYADELVELDAQTKQQAQAAAIQQEVNLAHSSEPAQQSGSDEVPSIVIDLQIEQLDIGSASFKDLALGGFRLSQAWQVKFKNDLVSGQAQAYDDGRPLDVALEYLHLPKPESAVEVDDSAEASKGKGSLAQLNAHELLPANVKLNELKVGEINYGNWQFKLRPIEGGVMLFDLFAQMSTLNLGGSNGRGAELVWLQYGEQNQSYFSANLQATDIGEAISSLYGEKVLTSKSASIDIDVQWQGSPEQMSLTNLRGLVDLDIRRGRFIRGATAGENPLVKLVGLFNFDTLARRLRLDFSDLHPEGMAYELVRGQLVFNSGQLLVNPPLYVDTPASQIQFAGEVDLEQQEVDAQLVATLPIAGNLTVAAALTGGIPTALTVYVLGKLFKKQMDKASSIRYKVEGEWSDPDVKFDKIFEPAAQKNAA